ncbi:hypothetical protein LTR84_012887 [Exophiala bonariae]|uniref:Fungal-type protein kinase domain-containing protein n=1 Tax=Exophiala bonariae TaxID=1690606 RepID=A0AAV9ND51_9EURO|nr:hypothetical protein LTR84_012887 [Exophiala bonariae]
MSVPDTELPSSQELLHHEPVPVEDNSSSDNLKAIWRQRIRNALRFASAASIEGDISIAASATPHFIRAFEYAPMDAAILLPRSLPPDTTLSITDRLFSLWARFRNNNGKILIPIDIKSFAWHVASQTHAGRTTKHLKGLVYSGPEQVKHCQALIIATAADANWVAFVPRFYYKKMDTKATSRGGQFFSIGNLNVSMAQFNPLPPILAPFVMPKHDLPKAIENMAEHFEDSQIKLRNPYSGNEYISDVDVQAQSIRTIKPENGPEATLRYKIWQAFKDPANSTDGSPEFIMENPVCSPITSDIRIDHVTGRSVFLELKQKHAQISESGKRLEHLQHTLGYRDRGIFTFRASWDYLLTMIDDNVGYLIRKDDIPRAWWHQEVSIEISSARWLKHDFPDRSFLAHRRVKFNATAQNIYMDFVRILKDRHGELMFSELSAENIRTFAGPCPSRLLGFASDQDTVDGELQVLNEVGEEQDPVSEEEEAQEDSRWGHARVFKTTRTDPRRLITGRRDAGQDATLFMPLMDECRRTGMGCMIDLGKWHPFGRMAMVQWCWSEEEKGVYDRTGKPPCWTGMLPSTTLMVTLCSQWSRWRLGYAPNEGSRGEVQAYLTAHPCIVVCSSLVKEEAHKLLHRWVVPSEFMPPVHVGELRKDNRMRKGPLFLEQGHGIEEFVVAEAELHRNILQFFNGEESIQIGLGAVVIKQPRSYLKTIGDYKKRAEADFNSGDHGRTLVISQLDEEA